MDIITESSAIEGDFKEGETQKIPLPDGSVLLLKKLGDRDHDPTQKNKAWQILETFSKGKETVTGLIYYQEQENFLDRMELSQKALVHWEDREIKPQAQNLQNILKGYS